MSDSRFEELPEEEKPRERLAKYGAHVLTDAQLLAIFLRTGKVGLDVLSLANLLIKEWGSLRRLAGCTMDELAKLPGMGPAKAAELKAAFEMGVRMARPEGEKIRVDRAGVIHELLAAEMQALPHELLKVLLLDTRHGLLEEREVSRGSLNESIAHPREIFRPAIAKGAYAIAVVHNHPSGDPQPSEADRRLTRRLVEAGTLLQIPLVDHVIIGAKRGELPPYFSFREAGLI
ncbi:MAG: DNA repair protein RadC [Verrucomicrobiota bacterium]